MCYLLLVRVDFGHLGSGMFTKRITGLSVPWMETFRTNLVRPARIVSTPHVCTRYVPSARFALPIGGRLTVVPRTVV